jgi:hypothetical protein
MNPEVNDNTFSFLNYSSKHNYWDEYLHEFTLAFPIIATAGLIGLFLGWIFWNRCKKRCQAIEAENAKIRAKRQAA